MKKGVASSATPNIIEPFFCLSGFTYRVDRLETKQNIIKRFKQIGGAYFLYNVALLILSLASYIVIHKGVTKYYLLSALIGVVYSSHQLYWPRTVEPNISFFIIQNAPLWYLTCFIIASIVFYVIVDKLSSMKKYTVAMALLVFMTVILAYIPIRLPWSMDVAFAGAFFMLFGVILKIYIIEKDKQFVSGLRLICLLLIYTVLCVINPGIAMSVREYGNHGVFSILIFFAIGCLGSVLYISLAQVLSKVSILKKGLMYIGQNTLTILGFHMFILVVLGEVEEKLGLNITSAMLYWIIGVLEVCIAICVCCVGSKYRRGFLSLMNRRNMSENTSYAETKVL